jgi:hypothetical protein
MSYYSRFRTFRIAISSSIVILFVTHCIGQDNVTLVNDLEFKSCLETKDNISKNINLSRYTKGIDRNTACIVTIFIDKNNIQFRDNKFTLAIEKFKSEVADQLNTTRFCLIQYSKDETKAFYFKEKSIYDNPIFIEHSQLNTPIQLNTFGEDFKYTNNQSNSSNSDKKYTLYLELNKDRCSNKNFLEPLHARISEICSHIENNTKDDFLDEDIQKIQANIVSLNTTMLDVLKKLNAQHGALDTLRKDIKNVTPQKTKVDVKSSKNDLIQFTYESNLQNYQNYKLGFQHLFKPGENNTWLIQSSLSTQQYSYSLFLEHHQYQWNNKNFSVHNIQETGKIQFQQAGMGVGRNWKLSNGSKTSGWGLQALIGGNINFIKNARYQWNDGSADIRGYINGISDEINNVPDIGFQDGLTLSGSKGNADLKKWFPSVEGEIKLLYQFQNISFAGGFGYTYSGKLVGNHPENPIYNGQQGNSLTTSIMPLRISTSYCSLSTILHF